jgi:hypothetical protein
MYTIKPFYHLGHDLGPDLYANAYTYWNKLFEI